MAYKLYSVFRTLQYQYIVKFFNSVKIWISKDKWIRKWYNWFKEIRQRVPTIPHKRVLDICAWDGILQSRHRRMSVSPFAPSIKSQKMRHAYYMKSGTVEVREAQFANLSFRLVIRYWIYLKTGRSMISYFQVWDGFNFDLMRLFLQIHL